MDRFVDERDFRLLESDPYTFFVLRRIIGGEVCLLLSDHRRLILCFSEHPYPVWIWTPDDAEEEEYCKAYELAQAHALLDGKHTFNMKYELAEYFIRRAEAEGKTLSVKMNLFAYDCPGPKEPDIRTDGGIRPCTEEDVEELAELIELFHAETGIDKKSREEYREDAIRRIGTGKMYFWVNEQARETACCQYAPTGDLASINLVYTKKEHRRKHYAENLVYQVTKIAQEAGYTPMLYTNADYAASNACYEKIGYVLRGKLCTIG